MELKRETVLDNSDRGTTGTLKRKLATCSHRCFFNPTKSLLLDSVVLNQPSKQCCSKNSCKQNYSNNYILKNYSNFMNSGLPQHLLFYRDGGWVDYNVQVISLIQEDFQAKKAITQVSFQGQQLLFDFVHMVEIDAETGSHKHLGWIDDHGCFFPPELSHTFHKSRIHLDSSSEENAHTYTELKDGPKLSSKYCKNVEYNVKRTKISKEPSHCVEKHERMPELQESVGENDICSMSPLENPYFERFPGKMEEVVSGGKVYDTVQKLLLMGVGNLIDANDIVGIFSIPPENPFGQMRLKRFLKQVEIFSNQRGDANVRYAWLASSKETVKTVMYEGLGNVRRLIYNPMYGCGLHLSPAKHSNLSVICSEVDENDMVHVVLCRVILGNLEQVHPGSCQSRPSSGSYDNGVDNFQNPNHYIVWDLHVDTHILPEYAVSIKVSPSAKGFLVGERSASPESGETVLTSLSSQRQTHPCDATLTLESSSSFSSSQWNVNTSLYLQGGNIKLISSLVEHSERGPHLLKKPSTFPRSPWMPFSMLFAAISTKISSQDMHLVSVHYDEYKRQKISRIQLIKMLRRIIGDKLLVSTITHLQRKLPSAVSPKDRSLVPR